MTSITVITKHFNFSISFSRLLIVIEHVYLVLTTIQGLCSLLHCQRILHIPEYSYIFMLMLARIAAWLCREETITSRHVSGKYVLVLLNCWLLMFRLPLLKILYLSSNFIVHKNHLGKFFKWQFSRPHSQVGWCFKPWLS